MEAYDPASVSFCSEMWCNLPTNAAEQSVLDLEQLQSGSGSLLRVANCLLAMIGNGSSKHRCTQRSRKQATGKVVKLATLAA